MIFYIDNQGRRVKVEGEQFDWRCMFDLRLTRWPNDHGMYGAYPIEAQETKEVQALRKGWSFLNWFHFGDIEIQHEAKQFILTFSRAKLIIPYDVAFQCKGERKEHFFRGLYRLEPVEIQRLNVIITQENIVFEYNETSKTTTYEAWNEAYAQLPERKTHIAVEGDGNGNTKFLVVA